MIPIHGMPLIAHIVRHLSSFKTIDEIIILADYKGLGKQIERYFENYRGLIKPLRFVQDSQSGTGGDLVHLEKSLGREKEFLLWFVDNLSPLDIDEMRRFHAKKKTLATIATRRFRKEETGFAIVDDGIITEFKEKPTIELHMAECLGIYILDREILGMIKARKAGKEINLSYDILQGLSKGGRISAYDIGKQPWIDVDSPARVEREKDLVDTIIRSISA